MVPLFENFQWLSIWTALLKESRACVQDTTDSSNNFQTVDCRPWGDVETSQEVLEPPCTPVIFYGLEKTTVTSIHVFTYLSNVAAIVIFKKYKSHKNLPYRCSVPQPQTPVCLEWGYYLPPLLPIPINHPRLSPAHHLHYPGR